ncbi:hypothetical protein LFL96_31290 [Paraburkholderia sp. D15]|nr:hypothetical protein [Paraburkholderia sp. D15]WGS52671.1 hypothetical protein LFL96_31290 [Paraburkholderia sp. D15]WKF61909.1 hypothetical protein HUO10_006441 [Paraburkholderia busanensis]
MEGLIKYESLLDGTLDMADVALLNDAISVKHENEARVQAYLEKKRR